MKIKSSIKRKDLRKGEQIVRRKGRLYRILPKRSAIQGNLRRKARQG